MTEEVGWTLAVEFIDQSMSFAHGFEMGRLYQMLKVETAPFDAVIMAENREMVVRICGRLAWSAEFKPLNENWVTVRLERSRKPALSVVSP